MIVEYRKGVAARLRVSVLCWSCTPRIRRRWGAGGCFFIGIFFINRAGVYQVVVYNAGGVPVETRQIVIQ
jgi:hypothetical protein